VSKKLHTGRVILVLLGSMLAGAVFASLVHLITGSAEAGLVGCLPLGVGIGLVTGNWVRYRGGGRHDRV
jgi:ABC-type uncharacterized transport system permease subunit